jgi:hypothetical protein
MPELGKKYTCYSCHTKFYDLGKPIPKCPKCGADQRDADEAPVVTTTRGRRAAVVEPEPIDEPEFSDDAPVAPATGDEEEDEIVPTTDDREEEAEEEEEEEY